MAYITTDDSISANSDSSSSKCIKSTTSKQKSFCEPTLPSAVEVQTSPVRKIPPPPDVLEVDSPWLNRKKAMVRRCFGKADQRLRRPKKQTKSKGSGESKEESQRRDQAPKLSRWDSEPTLETEKRTIKAPKIQRWQSSPQLVVLSPSQSKETRGRVPSSPAARSPKIPQRKVSRNNQENTTQSPFRKSDVAPSLKVDRDCKEGVQNLRRKVQRGFRN